MTGITELGYVRFGVTDIAAWRDFAAALLGLEVGDDSEPEQLFYAPTVGITASFSSSTVPTTSSVRACGWLAQRNSERFRRCFGPPICRSTSLPATGAATARSCDDDAGRSGRQSAGDLPRSADRYPSPVPPGRGMYGKFVTGDSGLGHMILAHQGLDATYDFYRRLGMRGSVEYRVPTPDGKSLDILFMHCNSRDHTLAFGLPSKSRVNHLMLEVDNLDDVFLTYELIKSKYPIVISPGRHANDQMFSFYCVSPSGFQIEIGWGGRGATHQSEYYSRDTYGHEFKRT